MCICVVGECVCGGGGGGGCAMLMKVALTWSVDLANSYVLSVSISIAPSDQSYHRVHP